MTNIIDLEKLWEDRQKINPEQLQIAPGSYLDPRHLVITAITITHSDLDQLLNSLQALCKQVLIREVIIINRQSSTVFEDKLAQFSQRHPKCYTVQGQKNLSDNQAYQLGARYASGQYLLFIDPRMDLGEQGILKLLSTGLRKPHPWVVGPDVGHGRALKPQHQAARLPQVSMLGGGVHVASLAPECLFLPAKDFFELKAQAGRRHATFHVDLCLRVHMAGGGVYQAQDIEYRLEPKPKRSLAQRLMDKWWQGLADIKFHFKDKSRKTNSIVELQGLGKKW